jgi:hypothetical protein
MRASYFYINKKNLEPISSLNVLNLCINEGDECMTEKGCIKCGSQD